MADSPPQGPATEGQGIGPSRSSGIVHWVKLVSGAIVGLAALLAAIAAIIDLLDKDPVPAVGARFAALEVSPTTLDDFQAMQEFPATGRPPVRVHLAAAITHLAQETPTEDGDGDATDTGEQPACPSPDEIEAGAAVPEGCPTGGQPCPIATDVTELELRVPDGCPEGGLECPTESEIAENATVPSGCPVEGLPDESDPVDPGMATNQLDQEYDMGRGCSGDPTGSNCALTAVARSAGGGQGASPARELSRVREVLAGTRTRIGPDGKRQPMGIMVSLDVTVTGMSGQRLKVYWSMISAQTRRALGQAWLRNTQAATLHPTANEDQLQKDLWLPLPKEPGRYRARVTLVNDAGRSYSERSDVFH